MNNPKKKKRKPTLERVYVPEDGCVCFVAVGIQDAVTLCGLTDYIGQEDGVETKAPVTCKLCISIVKEIQESQKETFNDSIEQLKKDGLLVDRKSVPKIPEDGENS